MFEVKSVKETFGIIYDNFRDTDPGSEKVSILDALGRLLDEDLVSDSDIPAFHRSSVDGYAVKAKDTFGASESMPCQLNIVGEVRMGEKPGFAIKSDTAAYSTYGRRAA